MLERYWARKPAASEAGNEADAAQAEICHKPLVDIEAGAGRRAYDGLDRLCRRRIGHSAVRHGPVGVNFNRAPIAVVVVLAAAAHGFAPSYFLQEPPPRRWNGRDDVTLDLLASTNGKRLVEPLAARLARIGLDIDPEIGRPLNSRFYQIVIYPCTMLGEQSAMAGREVAEPRTDQLRRLGRQQGNDVLHQLHQWSLHQDKNNGASKCIYSNFHACCGFKKVRARTCSQTSNFHSQEKLADTAPQIQHMHPGRNPRAPQKLFGQRVQDGSLQGETPPFAVVVPHDILRLRRRFGSADAFTWGNGGFAGQRIRVVEDIAHLDQILVHDLLVERAVNSLAISARPLLDWRDN